MMWFTIEFIGYVQDTIHSSGEEFMAEGSPINQNKNDDNDVVNMDVNGLNKEEKQNSHMDSGIRPKSDDNHDKSPHTH
ncbi:unnamed protein product [Adineta ricciae]|uniref:Uncharacterized protein n=1 Tax=Adineta ricciae TaxID=249248 RepID=A0A815NQP5_ADIRI|nr:unnamed protein product [Adineta ricciae]